MSTPTTPLSSWKRRIVTFFNSSSSTKKQNVQTTTRVSANDPDIIPTSKPSLKRPKVFKNIRLPWKKRSRLPPHVSQPPDLEHFFQESPRPGRSIQYPIVAQGRNHCRSRSRDSSAQRVQESRVISRCSSRITVGTDNHSLMDAQSEFSVSLPLSPVYRYRMHYGSSIENIENMGKAPHYPDHPTPAAAATASAAAPACASFSSDDPVEVQYIQELDKEMAQASIRVTKKRLSKRFHLNLNGCSHPSASTVSSTPSSPVSVVRCKTSRGTYDASNPSTPTTPTSTRSFLSSMPLKSPTFSQLFSTKVAPSRQASPKPFSRPESFHNLQGHQGPIMLTKEHIEHIRRIESRLCVLEKSVPRPEQHHRDVKQDQPPSPQHQLQHTVHDHPTTPHQLTTTDNTDYIQQQQLRTKRSSIRRIGAGGSDLRTSHVQRRISAIDRTDCQSPPGFFNCVPQSYSFHDWSTIGWDRPISAGAGIQEPSSSLLSRQQEHPFDDQSDRTEQEQVKERVVSRMRLESALWEIEALLRQYETLVVQDWGLKFDHLYNERRVVRNPQELPA